jgi:Flp pilus assembly pilin Flp
MRDPGSGQALIEYVVLLAMGSVVAIGAVAVAGPQLSAAYSQVNAVLANPAAATAPTASPTPTPVVSSTPTLTPEPTPTPAPAPTSSTEADNHGNSDAGSHPHPTPANPHRD